MLVIRQLAAPIDFHSRKKYRLWKSMGAANCLITKIFQNIFFCVKQKKETHTVLSLCHTVICIYNIYNICFITVIKIQLF